MDAFSISFRDDRRMIEIPELRTVSAVTPSLIAMHAHPHLTRYGTDWQVTLGAFGASGEITFRKKHVGPIKFQVGAAR